MKEGSEALRKAREYEQNSNAISEDERAAFHVCTPIGWMNDPNGFSEYKGEKHLFFQYYPYDIIWGPMHWGHCKTEDFIKWEYLPAALAPDQSYDNHGCFSGSALEDQGRHILLYTGVFEVEEDGKKKSRQVQCLAVGDGTDYQKVSSNPIITTELLPEGSSLEDFRDPKLWKEADGYYVVAGSRSADGSGQIPLFYSADLEKWECKGILAANKNQYGKMWECPDFFELDGKHVLIISPQDMEAAGLEYHAGNNTMAVIGDLDKERCTGSGSFDETDSPFHIEYRQAIDYGLDFYAPQTMQCSDGRRILTAWMQSWDNHMMPQGAKWSGMMTIPRELSVIDGRLYQNPVKEIEKYYTNTVTCRDVLIGNDTQLDQITGRFLDMTVTVEPSDYNRFQIKLAQDEAHETVITYRPKENTLCFDRTHAGATRDVIGSRTMFVENLQGKIQLRILMDRYSVEVFINQGKYAMTSLIFTDVKADKINFSADQNITCSVVKHDIK